MPKTKARKPPEGIDRLPSGKFRARHVGPDGKRRSGTFAYIADAKAWLATQQADAIRRTWKAPEQSKRTVGAYANDYLTRGDLRESTRALYRGLWERHLKAGWGDMAIGDVTAQMVRSWHAEASSTTGPTALAQSYRLLRSIVNVAVTDDVIPVNPCRIRGAGTPKPARASRSLKTGEVLSLSKAVPSRYRALVLVLAFGGLRFGEATELRRKDVSLDGTRLTIARSARYLQGRWVVGEPKTAAGHRSVALPSFVATELLEHLRTTVPEGSDALVFGTRSGKHLHSANFGQTFKRAVQAVGLPPVRVHELRHTGATLAAGTPGVTTRELMRRLGHATPSAALIYQHALDDRDADIARALDDVIATAPLVPASHGKRGKAIRNPKTPGGT